MLVATMGDPQISSVQTSLPDTLKRAWLLLGLLLGAHSLVLQVLVGDSHSLLGVRGGDSGFS